MTLQELRYLVALAETGHFGQAAEACFVSQSTLSTGLKKLEEQLGIVLFDRSLKRVMPTPIGREIVGSARLILLEAERIRQLAKYAEDPMGRTVQIGVIPTLGPYYLPHAMLRVCEAYPKLRLLLREVMTPHLLAQLHEGTLDAGLLALPIDEEGLTVAPLFSEPFLAAVPAGHALAKKAKVSLDELSQANLLLLEEGHCLRDQALAVCGLQGLAGEEVRATSLETLRQMVAMDIGVTLLPRLACAGPALPGIAIKPLADKGAGRVIALVWRKRTPYLDTMTRLAQTLARNLPEGVKRPA
ncbi:MAG: LysR family transcriptional regulator [Betaproteobacteria bacterium]|nr:LysR family transcriptional regulator [Betaproteobacteria bacterium]